MPRGFRSEIFVDTVDDATVAETLPVLSYPESAQPGDVVVYQFATASAMAPWLAGRRETLVVNYHNVTPPELMAPWDNHLALGQLRAQGDLRLLPRGRRWRWPTRRTTRPTWFVRLRATAVISPSAALDAGVTIGADPVQPAAGATGGGARWLAVGRVSPNKALESTIAALAVARGPRRPRRNAPDHRQAGDRFLCRRTAPLRRRARPGPPRCGSPAMPAMPPLHRPMPRRTCWS